MSALLVLLAVAVGAGLLGYLVSYNSLVSARQQVSDAWAAIDVELDRRHTLIPGLVSAVQATAAHERVLLERLVATDRRARETPGSAAERSLPESELATAARAVVALRERYPALDSQRNFLQLQEELAVTEDRIGAARRFHNIKVAEYNRRTQAVPGNLVTRRHQFALAEYFDLAADGGSRLIEAEEA
jgi:LemA protein